MDILTEKPQHRPINKAAFIEIQRSSPSEKKPHVITYHKNFKDREKNILKQRIAILPTELQNHVAKINVLGRGTANLARFEQERGFGKGILELNRAFFEKNEQGQELILLHEVAGHGLLDALNSLSPDRFATVKNVWESLFNLHANLAYKDKSASYHKNEGKGIGDIDLKHEEFIANRLAEYVLKNTQKYGDNLIHFLRNKDKSFTDSEEEIVQKACEETYNLFIHSTKEYEQANSTEKFTPIKFPFTPLPEDLKAA